MIAKEVKDLLKNKMTIISRGEEKSLCLVGPVRLPVQLDDQVIQFKWYTWLPLNDKQMDKAAVLESLSAKNLAALQQSSVLVYGDLENAEEALVRMHSICHTGDIFGSKRCDCGYQLRQSMRMIEENGNGALFYLADQEGRGIGLVSKTFAYLLQQEGYDTVEANHALDFEDDIRNYDEAISVLNILRNKPVTLITNNPRKLAALQANGLLANHHLSLWGDISEYNQHYLETKIEKAGHLPEKTAGSFKG